MRDLRSSRCNEIQCLSFQHPCMVEVIQGESVGSILHGEILTEGILTQSLQMLQAILVSSCQQSVCHAVEIWCLPSVNETHHCLEDLRLQIMDLNIDFSAILHVMLKHGSENWRVSC